MAIIDKKDPNAHEGMRVKLINMIDDPNPIPNGTEGTISLIDGAGIIHVDWDNGRRLGLIPGVDEYEIEPGVQDFFNTVSEEKKIEMSPTIKSSMKSKGIKTGQVNKSFKSAKIKGVKVESEDDIKEMTGAGGAATGAVSSSGSYVGPMGATKPTFGKGPLTKKKGVSKPGPLNPKNENIITKEELIKEITNSTDVASFDDTRFEAWSDKNRDGWKWNDKPAYHEDGEIIDPLAKIDATWDDDNLDISKEWDKHQLKKEDFLRLVKKRLNEVGKDKVHTKKWDRCVEKVKKSGNVDSPEAVCTKSLGYEGSVKKSHRKKEEKTELEETTTFGSVWGSNGPPVGPAFAAKQGQWRTGKKPIWKGGKIVQRIENSGVLNPVNEANTVKYNPGGKFVKIKKKCTKFPYCSQGAIDKPLNISDKMTEPGTYVEEQLMKNIHEVAKMTGKSFQEVYNIVKNQNIY
jgi:hypothetical protein